MADTLSLPEDTSLTILVIPEDHDFHQPYLKLDQSAYVYKPAKKSRYSKTVAAIQDKS